MKKTIKIGAFVRNIEQVEIIFGGGVSQIVPKDTLGVVEYHTEDDWEHTDIGVRWVDAGGKGVDYHIEVKESKVQVQNIGFHVS